jgi:hypothetical protein
MHSSWLFAAEEESSHLYSIERNARTCQKRHAVCLIEGSQKQQQQHRQALSQNRQTSRRRRIVEVEVGGEEVRVEILKQGRWNTVWANLVFPLNAEVGDYCQVPDSSDVFTSGWLSE